MHRKPAGTVLGAALGLALAFPTLAQTAPAPTPEWTGSGEFGLTSASGNTRSQNLNAQLKAGLNDGNWHHNATVFWLRNRGETKPGNGVTPGNQEMRDTANRYGLGLSSAYDLSARSYLVGGVRYDHDNFATYLWRGVASVGYGYRWFDDARMRLLTEIGPGFRRSHDKKTGKVENEAIGRGFADFSYRLTDNTKLLDSVLVESGRLGTFVQNDLGVQVAMSQRLALKLGYQVRYNSKVDPGFKKTDTVTMLNLVYAVE
ncbi:MAG TPA: DUF481 domain-containing protein [Stenotrophomonas sp.]|jgi:putative salt-induced outer membrane protein